MSDYTLPPVPKFELPFPGFGGGLDVSEIQFIESYGHARAEHARAPLLARIAELENYCHEWNRQVVELHEGRDRLRVEVEKLTLEARVREIGVMEQRLTIQALASDREELRAEVEKYKADAERWQFWKPRLICADFEYVLDHQGFSVLVFEIPDGVQVSADLDKTTDTAIAARKGEGSE